MVVIDAHTHFGDKGKASPPNTARDLVAVMDGFGIDAMVTTPPYSAISYERDYEAANAFVADAMRQYPHRIFGLARVNPHFREIEVARVDKWLAAGFWGIKFHPRNEAMAANDPVLVFPIMEVAAKHRKAVLFHTGEPDTYGFAQPTLCGDVADMFPGLPVVIGHMGKRLFDDAILIAKWFDNVVLETSFRSPHDIEKAVRTVGPERVVYGSDFYMGGPFGPDLEMMKVKLASIPQREKEMVLGDNINRILRLGVKRRVEA